MNPDRLTIALAQRLGRGFDVRAFDAKKPDQPPKFSQPRATELEFYRQLRGVARTVGGIVRPFLDGEGGITDESSLQEALRLYANKVLGPWAAVVSTRLIEQVGTTNLKHWERSSVQLGDALRSVFARTSIGQVARQLHTDQVGLIKSLPLEAAERAVTLASNARLSGVRASVVAEQLAQTENVTASRAKLIARTEVAKANAALTRARAEFVGAEYYIWRTMQDPEVRESHAELEGEVFRFDDPPEIEGEGAHGPGDFPNCRCFPEPIITGRELDAGKEAQYRAASRYWEE